MANDVRHSCSVISDQVDISDPRHGEQIRVTCLRNCRKTCCIRFSTSMRNSSDVADHEDKLLDVKFYLRERGDFTTYVSEFATPKLQLSHVHTSHVFFTSRISVNVPKRFPQHQPYQRQRAMSHQQHPYNCGLFMTPAATNESGVGATSALPAPIAIDAAEDVYRYYLQQPEPWAVLPRLVRPEFSRSYAPSHFTRLNDDLQDDSMMSKSIPIPGTITKTNSEVQLCEDERVADYRDYVVFSRIVDHITRQQFASRNLQCRYENDDCLLHIIRTRQGDSDLEQEENPQDDVAMQDCCKQPDSMKCDPGYFYVTDQDTNTCFSTNATTTPLLYAHSNFGQKTFMAPPIEDDDEEMFLLEL